MAQRQPGGQARADAAEVAQHALADRFQGFETVAAFRGMNAHHLGVGAIHRDESSPSPLGGGRGLVSWKCAWGVERPRQRAALVHTSMMGISQLSKWRVSRHSGVASER